MLFLLKKFQQLDNNHQGQPTTKDYLLSHFGFPHHLFDFSFSSVMDFNSQNHETKYFAPL